MLTTIIVTVILGAIIGALARLVLPGKQNISTLMTVILGIIGALIGSWLWTGVFNKSDTSPDDLITALLQSLFAHIDSFEFEDFNRLKIVLLEPISL